MILPPAGLVFMQFGNLRSYAILNALVFFAYLLALLTSQVTPSYIFICRCFKIPHIEVLMLQNARILCIFYAFYSFMESCFDSL